MLLPMQVISLCTIIVSKSWAFSVIILLPLKFILICSNLMSPFFNELSKWLSKQSKTSNTESPTIVKSLVKIDINISINVIFLDKLELSGKESSRRIISETSI